MINNLVLKNKKKTEWTTLVFLFLLVVFVIGCEAFLKSIAKNDFSHVLVYLLHGIFAFLMIKEIGKIWLAKTNRRAAEKEEIYQDMLASVDDVFFFVDEKWIIQYISPSIQFFMQYSDSELIGSRYMNLVHSQDIASLRSEIGKAPFTIEGIREYRLNLKKEGNIMVQTSFKPIVKQGKMVGHYGVMRDITKWKKNQELIKKLDQKKILQEVAGATAHEINQPLTVIFGSIDLILGKMTLDNYTREKIRNIYLASQNINNIVHKMQNVSEYSVKPYAGGLEQIVDFDGNKKASS